MKNPQDIKNFGTHLRKLREDKNISQQELADRADIARSTIERIENSRYVARIDVVFSIAKALEIPFEKMFEFKSEINSSNN